MEPAGSRRIIKTILVSGLGVLIGYAVSFLITPYITENIGIEAYGFVAIADAAVSYAQFFSLALTSFIVRYITVSYHQKAYADMSGYYSSSVAACTALSVIILGTACIFITRLDRILRIPEELTGSVKLLFFAVFLNNSLNLAATPFLSAAYIRNRLDLQGWVRIAAKLSEAALIALFLGFMEPRVWFIGAGTCLSSFLILIAGMIMTRRLTPELKFDRMMVSAGKILTLIRAGIWNAVNHLGNLLNTGLDLLISNLILTAAETGEIAVAKYIVTIFSTLIGLIIHPFQPRLLKAYAEGVREDFLREMSVAMRVCGFFGALAFSGFAALGALYFRLWTPSQNASLLHILTIIAVFNLITDSILQPVYYVYTLTVRVRIPCYVTIAGGLLNVLSMYLLLKMTALGSFAIVLTTAVIMVTINLSFNPLYAARCLKMSARFFYRILIRHLAATGLMTLIMLLIRRLLQPSGWAGLVISALVMSAAGAVCYLLLILSRDERKGLFRKMPGRKKA